MKKLRDELVALMPGYKWTVHKAIVKDQRVITATGTTASGSNRTSTLQVDRRVDAGQVSYTARSAGYGTRAKWLASADGRTLAQALQNLQDHYEGMASKYSAHAGALQKGRRALGGEK
nr:hypothetical protein [uncultured Holophaga sp.]